MAINWFNTTGIPPDTLGSPGDRAWDTNGFTWGPKTTTWVGTANNFIGATGPAGASALTPFFGAMHGPSVDIKAVGVLLGSMSVIPGSAYTPKQQSYFLGASFCVLQGSFYMELYDQTAGVSIYKSAVFGAGSVASFGPFPAASAAFGGIPLTTGNTVVWRVGGTLATTASGNVEPVYYDLVNPPSVALGTSIAGTVTASANQSSTAQTMRIPGATSYIKYFRPIKTAYMHRVAITNPGSTGYVTAYLATLGNSSGTASADGIVICRNVDASGAVFQVPPNTTWVSPNYGRQYQLNPGVNYVWYTQGTANGIVTLSQTLLM